MNKDLALKLMEEGDNEAELAARKKKGKVKDPCSLSLSPSLYLSVSFSVSLSEFRINENVTNKTEILSSLSITLFF